MKLLRQHLPARLQNAIAQAVPVGVRDWVVSRAMTAGYEWNRTPAFPLLADYNGYLRFNLKDRESSGCLQAGGPNHLRYQKWLKEKFRGLHSTDCSGNHRHEGFVIVQTPEPAHTEWQSVSHITDLAPVLLKSFLGHPKGEA